jgi:hypothetical protein
LALRGQKMTATKIKIFQGSFIVACCLIGCATTGPDLLGSGSQTIIRVRQTSTLDQYECERDMRTSRPGFSGQGSTDVNSGAEAAYLLLFGMTDFRTLKDDQAANGFFPPMHGGQRLGPDRNATGNIVDEH